MSCICYSIVMKEISICHREQRQKKPFTPAARAEVLYKPGVYIIVLCYVFN